MVSKYRLGTLVFSTVIAAVSCSQPGPAQDTSGDFVPDASSYINKAKRTMGQMMRYAALRPDHTLCLLGTVTAVKAIETASLGNQYYLEFEQASNICSQVEIDSSIIGSLGRKAISIGQSCVGNSGTEIIVGSEVFILASTQVGTVFDPQTQSEYSFIGRTGPVFDLNSSSKYLFRGEGSSYRLVEEALVTGGQLRQLAKNAIKGQMATFDELCLDPGCTLTCKPHQVSSSLSTAPNCSSGSCYYGAECTDVTVLSEPDLCTECGDSNEEPGIIQREIDGVLHCWDSATYQEVTCP